MAGVLFQCLASPCAVCAYHLTLALYRAVINQLCYSSTFVIWTLKYMLMT